jgi:hypothetical protein
MAEAEPSYIDYETFLDPEFSAASFANVLVTSTNNANDTPLDLATPLSRVLFDLQEIDTHIHTLTTKSALPLLSHTKNQTDASGRILQQVEEQVTALTDGYQRLEREVLRKWENAEETRIASENSLATLRLTRAVVRCITLSRQLEGQVAEVTGRASGKEDHRAMIRASNSLLMLRQLFSATREGEEGYGLDQVKVIRTMRNDVINPAENTVKARAQQAINNFKLSSLSAEPADSGTKSPPTTASTFAQTEETKARLSSAMVSLYLLSPTPNLPILVRQFKPELLLSTLQGYIHNSITSALSTLARALGQLPLLDRALTEVSARCQDMAALETLLASFKNPLHPLLVRQNEEDENKSVDAHSSQTITTSNGKSPDTKSVLEFLLQILEASSLPSYFWRSLSSSLPARVQELLSRGGAPARALKTNRDRIRAELKECVVRGSQIPATVSKLRSAGGGPVMVGNWEREAAVMVGSVINALNR